MTYSYDIVFCVPGLPFDGNTLRDKSLGGSETAALCMAREMARLGHRVRMFCATERPGVYDGVLYDRFEDWQSYALTTPHDVSIIQRAPQLLTTQLASRVTLLWCHDLALRRQRDQLLGTAWAVDRYLVLSRYMADQYREVYDLPEEFLWETRNGLDLDLIPAAAPEERDPRSLVYSARPERGLDVLIDLILPRILEQEDVTLTILGYDNAVDHLRDFYAEIGERCRPYGDRVRHGGCLTKPDLYEAYSRAGVYVYPTPGRLLPEFAEISCITAMEAMACGLPIVTSDRGALSETISPGAGVLLAGDSTSPEYAEAFAGAVVGLIRNPAARDQMAEEGRKRAASLGWADVARDWTDRLDRLFDELNGDRMRLARHFLRHSDIFACERAFAHIPTAEGNEFGAHVGRIYNPITRSQEGFRHHYVEGGKNTDERLSQRSDPEHLFRESEEPRFHVIEQFLADRPEIQTILDFGCGHGWADVYLHNRVGRAWVGVDIDPAAVSWSRTYADRYAAQPAGLEFVEGDESVDLDERQFDMLLASEVLEHLVDPFEALERLEHWVKPGGTVLITVPYGPSEFGTWNWWHFRNHLWEFEPQDLRDIFGGKPELSIASQVIGRNELTGDPVGFSVVTYRADQKPLGRIDWERKLRVQRPRETVSVSMIAGGDAAEETLHWALRSVLGFADEVVVGAANITAETRRIAAQYDIVRLVDIPNPLTDGFDVARNAALDECRCDWVLWLDCDERVVDPGNIPKYLRRNVYDGYAIRQHHLSVDAGFQPDMPTRLFRRVDRLDGKQMRFHGALHEHPETALNEGPGRVIALADVHIAHLGYISESDRRRRFRRNNPLLQRDMQRNPDRRLQKHFIMRDLCTLTNHELAENGGQVTELMRARARQVKTLYRAHFLGQPAYMGSDPLQYYTHALNILVEGIDVGFSLAVARDGRGDSRDGQLTNGGMTVGKFASFDEARQEIEWRLKDKFAPLEGEWW